MPSTNKTSVDTPDFHGRANQHHGELSPEVIELAKRAVAIGLGSSEKPQTKPFAVIDISTHNNYPVPVREGLNAKNNEFHEGIAIHLVPLQANIWHLRAEIGSLVNPEETALLDSINTIEMMVFDQEITLLDDTIYNRFSQEISILDALKNTDYFKHHPQAGVSDVLTSILFHLKSIRIEAQTLRTA